MGTGIIVCGLNGSGKSTLGKALAKALEYYFIDNEDLFFPKLNPQYIFSSPRSRKKVKELLMSEVKKHENFVFASVKGNYGEGFLSLCQYIVLMEAPKDTRLQRVKNRSFQKFGSRMLPGGDLYEQEKAFFDLVSSRTECEVTEWAESTNYPVIRVDGAKPVEENAAFIIKQLRKI